MRSHQHQYPRDDPKKLSQLGFHRFSPLPDLPSLGCLAFARIICLYRCGRPYLDSSLRNLRARWSRGKRVLDNSLVLEHFIDLEPTRAEGWVSGRDQKCGMASTQLGCLMVIGVWALRLGLWTLPQVLSFSTWHSR